MPSIYLAGKIGKDDWRHELTGWALRHAWQDDSDGETLEAWPVLKRSILDTFDYVGPYFISDDHGCGHGDGTHGCGTDGRLLCSPDEDFPKRPQVRDLCLAAIDAADIVFAWLDDVTAYGTLVEIGYAKGRSKPVVVAAPRLSNADPHRAGELSNEMWFAFSCATHTLAAPSPREALQQVVDLFPTLESPIEEAFWAAHREAGLEGLRGLKPQHPVFGGKYRLDFALPERKIGIELDGYTWHSSPEAFTRDRARQRELELDGWRIIRFSGSEITKNPADCVRQAAELAARIAPA
ncbi:DUF559 domain-containing protein [Streptomyces microflavus]|uniref:DUF559 domain-containing protein n=1 Tax=Streptomyces microflavus TaxID=1919 RepID=UPI0033DC51C1